MYLNNNGFSYRNYCYVIKLAMIFVSGVGIFIFLSYSWSITVRQRQPHQRISSQPDQLTFGRLAGPVKLPGQWEIKCYNEFNN